MNQPSLFEQTRLKPLRPGTHAYRVVSLFIACDWTVTGLDIMRDYHAMDFRQRVSDIRAHTGVQGCIVDEGGRDGTKRWTRYTVPVEHRAMMRRLIGG